MYDLLRLHISIDILVSVVICASHFLVLKGTSVLQISQHLCPHFSMVSRLNDSTPMYNLLIYSSLSLYEPQGIASIRMLT